jgi:hypothetical protein
MKIAGAGNPQMQGRMSPSFPKCPLPSSSRPSSRFAFPAIIGRHTDPRHENIHGSPEQAESDRQRRLALRDQGYEVMEYPVSALSDRSRIASFFFRLARLLTSREHAENIQSSFNVG